MDDFDYIGMVGVEKSNNQKLRTANTYNMPLIDKARLDDSGMPALFAVDYVPSKLIGFEQVLTSNDASATVHFFIDDYRFERVWTNPARYAELLGRFDACFTPDFSLYTDMPLPLQQWNIYRSRLIGAY